MNDLAYSFKRHPGRSQPPDTWESFLAPLGPNDRRAYPIVGARLLWSGETAVRYCGETPADDVTGRECRLCPAILSRWNTEPICGPCQREARAVWPPLEIKPESVVYYATDGKRIKIGTSGEVHKRVAVQRATLLAVEPGGFAHEAARHRQFAHLRIEPRGEWFRPAPDLLALVASLSDADRLAS